MPSSTQLAGTVHIRFAEPDDAVPLAAAYIRNRGHLRPWEPRRSESFFTPEGQRAVLAAGAAEQGAGRSFYWLLTDGDQVVGRISLTDVVRGAFQNGHLGYWVDAAWTGRGLASAAVEHVSNFAAGTLGLHRLQAATAPDNAASQAVLTHCGFTRIGTAEKYLFIDGTWRDHVIYARILEPAPPR